MQLSRVYKYRCIHNCDVILEKCTLHMFIFCANFLITNVHNAYNYFHLCKHIGGIEVQYPKKFKFTTCNLFDNPTQLEKNIIVHY